MAMNAAALAGLPDPIILVDENRRVLRLNPAAVALLGHDLTGRELALGIRNPDLLAAVDAVLKGGEQAAVEFTVPGKLERTDRMSTRLNSSHQCASTMPSSL